MNGSTVLDFYWMKLAQSVEGITTKKMIVELICECLCAEAKKS